MPSAFSVAAIALQPTLACHLEDSTDHFGFVLVETAQFSRVFDIGRVGLGDRTEAVGSASGRKARKRPALQATMGLRADQLEKRVVDQGQRAEGQPGSLGVRRDARGAVDDVHACRAMSW